MMLPTQSPHHSIFQRAMQYAENDSRIVGLALHFNQDDLSSEELVIVTLPEHFAQTAKELEQVAASFGPLLMAYEPVAHTTARELICLFEEPVDRLDLKLMTLPNLPLTYSRVLWQRGTLLSDTLAGQRTVPSHLDLQWMEDRFWVWLHSAASSLREGALFQTLNSLENIRAEILGPLLLSKNNKPLDQLSELESCTCEESFNLRSTVPTYEAKSCESALREAAKLYVGLRETLAPSALKRHQRAEMAVMRHLHSVRDTL